MARPIIYGIFFFALFINSLFQFGVPKYFAVGTEVLIYSLIIISLLKRIGKGVPIPHLWYSFFFMVIIGACSITINGSSIERSIYSLRLLYRFYFFYIGLIFLELDEWEIKKINEFIAILLIMQLPVVAIKFYYYGMSELTIGAYSDVGGSLTTMLPIVSIFYLAAYYFLYHADLKYIILIFAFLLFSIVGKKRAVAFLYPIQFIAIFYFIYVKGKNVTFSKKMATLFLILSLIVVVFSSILYFNETLNPEGKIGGRVDVLYAINYAKNYTTGLNAYGHTTGRISTTIRTFESLWDSGFAVFFFGFGPGSTTISIFDSAKKRENLQLFFDRLKIAYGLTTMNKIALEYGLLGVLTFSLIVFLFAPMCWRYYKYESDPYWKAFAAGSVGFAFSMLFFFFAYHFPAFWGDTLPAIYFYTMAVVYTRLQKINVFRTGSEGLT